MPLSSRHAALVTIRQNRVAAGLVALVIVGTPTFNWYYASSQADDARSFAVNVDNHFQQLRAGLCKIILHSNKLAQENKAALLTTAARAERRARIDQAAGRTSLVQTDRDAAALDRKFAGEIKPTILNGCPS